MCATGDILNLNQKYAWMNKCMNMVIWLKANQRSKMQTFIFMATIMIKGIPHFNNVWMKYNGKCMRWYELVKNEPLK